MVPTWKARRYHASGCSSVPDSTSIAISKPNDVVRMAVGLVEKETERVAASF